MAVLNYTGSYSGTDSLNVARTVSLMAGGQIANYRVDSLAASVYLSTNAYSKTYKINISVIGAGGATVASGQVSQKFTSQNYTGAWVTVPLTILSGFDPNGVGSMVVSDSTADASKVFIKSNTMTLAINYTQYSYCTAPTSVSAPATGVPGGSAVISWSGAAAGSNMTISGYNVYRATSQAGEYSYIGYSTSTSYTDTGLPTNVTLYYKIMTVGSVSGYNSGLSNATAGTAVYYGAVSAPTTVSAPASGVPGGSVTITYSGAKNGTNTVISRYDIYRATAADGTYTKVGQSTTGSYTDTNLPANVTLYYKVKAIANVSGYDSDLSAATSGTAVYYGACTAPTTVNAPTLATPDGVTVTWSGASAGTNVSIASYEIYRATEAEGSYAKVGTATGQTYTDTSVSGGNTYYYKIKTIANVAGYDSGLSNATTGTKVNAVPGAPTVRTDGTIYNRRPRILVTAGTDTDGDALTIGATGYTASSSPVASEGKAILRKSVETTGAQTVTVVNTDPNAGTASTETTFTVGTLTWTDDPIIAGTTQLKAAHMNEIRAALDNVCDYYGLNRTAWAEEIIAGVTPDINWPAHVAEIRQTITRVANFVNSWDTESATHRIVLPAMKTALRPSAEVMNQLRDMILLL